MVNTPANFALIDDFNRSDQTPPGPLWAAGQIWSDNVGTLQTLSNQLASTGAGYRDARLTASYARPVCVSYEIATVGADGGVTWMWLPDVVGTTAPSGYTFYISWASGNDTIEMQRYTSGAATLLGSQVTSISLAAGDRIALIVDSDDSVHIWHKPSAGGYTKIQEVTDSGGSRRAGPFYPGAETNSTSLRFDNMIAGNVATTGPPRGSLSLLGVGR